MNARDLRVLIELNSVDLRIGAVNDALDLVQLASPLGVRFVVCGPLSEQFCRDADARGAATLAAESRIFSRRGLPAFAVDVVRWCARLRRLQIDIVHLNYASYGPSLACAAWVCSIPAVGRPGPFIPGNLSNRWLAAYVANCRAHAAELLDSPLADRVLIAGDLFRPGRLQATLTAHQPLPPRRPGVPRVLFLGQLVERKGLHVLVDAFARLDTPAELLLAGGDWASPGYPQRVKAMARDLGIEDRVHFENHREDVGALLGSADVFVLPSLSEARPRSIIEAMSLGLAVVGTDTGGIPSLIISGQTGLLAAPGDALALAGCLDRLVRNPELRQRLGSAARRHAAESFSADRTAAEYVQLYRRLADRRRSAHAGFPVHA